MSPGWHLTAGTWRAGCTASNATRRWPPHPCRPYPSSPGAFSHRIQSRDECPQMWGAQATGLCCSVAAGRLTTASACPPPSCHLVSPVLPVRSSTARPSRAPPGPPDYQVATTLGQGQQRGLCLAVFMSEEGKEPPKEATLPHRGGTSPLGAVGSTGTFSRSCEVSPASHRLWGSVRTRLRSPGAGSASRLAPRGPCQGADGQRRAGRN